MVDYKIVASLAIGYGFILLAAFQLGFFTAIGFQYVGLTAVSDFWANFGIIAACSAAAGATFLVLLILFQVSGQSGFNLVRWIADNSNTVAIISASISLVLLVALLYNKSFFPLIMVMALPAIAEISVTYCNLIANNKVMVWSAVISVASLVALSFCIGLYAGYFKIALDMRKYDIIVDGGKIEGVRLIRTSSAGVIYANDHHQVAFVNLAKIVSIVPASLRP